MNQEAKIAKAKPVLNAESFQRLLAAAYMLQIQNDRRLSVQPIDTTHTSPFAAGSVIQHRIPAVIIQGQELRAGQPDTVLSDDTEEHAHSDRLESFVEPVVLRDVNVLSMNSMSWKTVEALAIAIVFCVMTGLSIHRLSGHPSNISLSAGTLERRNVSQPARLATSVSASGRQTLMGRNSRQPGDDGEGDIVAKDLTIHYQNRSIGLHAGAADRPGPMQAQLVSPENTTSTPRVRFSSGRAAGWLTANTVVQYGPDVTMWLTNPTRTSLARPTR